MVSWLGVCLRDAYNARADSPRLASLGPPCRSLLAATAVNGPAALLRDESYCIPIGVLFGGLAGVVNYAKGGGLAMQEHDEQQDYNRTFAFDDGI